MLLSSPRSRGLRTTHSYNPKHQMGYMEIDLPSSRQTQTQHSTSQAQLPTKDMAATNPEMMGNIEPNTLYLTFNAPKVDDYHRGLFLTYPPRSSDSTTSGTLFHATYNESLQEWDLESRSISDISKAKTLVLLFKVHTMEANSTACLEETFERMHEVFEQVPMGREARTRAYGECPKGNPKLGGYDCVIWTGDALRALVGEGLIVLGGPGVDEVMAEARALAGPRNAREAVGKPIGGLKIR